MMKTLLFATAAVTALAVAAPAFARERHGATIRYYRGISDTNGYAWSGPGGTDAVGNRIPSGVRGVYLPPDAAPCPTDAALCPRD
jgi:hypothetical protein